MVESRQFSDKEIDAIDKLGGWNQENIEEIYDK